MVTANGFLTRLRQSQGGVSLLLVVTLVLFVSVVSMTAGVGAFYYIRSTSMIDEALLHQTHRAKALAAKLEAHIISTKQLVESATTLFSPLRNDKQRLERTLLRLYKSAPLDLVYGIGVWFEPNQFIEGETYVGPYAQKSEQGVEITQEWAMPEYDYLSQPWYSIAKTATDDLKFTKPFLDAGMVFVSAVKAMLDNDKNIIGVVSVETISSLMRQLLIEASHATPETIFYVSVGDGTLFIHPQDGEVVSYFNQSEQQKNSILDVHIDDLEAFNAEYFNNVELQTISYQINYVDWVLHVTTPKHVLFKEVRELRFGIIYGIAFLWIILFLLLLLLAKLNAHARKIREEQERLEAEVQERQQTEAFLHQMNDELEQRVQERTAELSNANEEIRQLNQLLATENRRMGAELNVTRRLQQMVLPREWELLAIKHLDISCLMAPATEVGGDYYDVLRHGDRVKIGIGDVTGHGLASGVLMMMVQTAVRTLLTNDVEDAHQFMNVLNRTIYDNVQRMEVDKNLTLSLLDYQNGTVRITGQHEDILIFRAHGEEEHIDTYPLGFMVGIEPDISSFVSSVDVTLQPGDGIVLYTDGITEARNAQSQLYGLERLCRVVREHWHLSAHDTKQAIFNDVRAYIKDSKQLDDITLLILKQK